MRAAPCHRTEQGQSSDPPEPRVANCNSRRIRKVPTSKQIRVLADQVGLVMTRLCSGLAPPAAAIINSMTLASTISGALPTLNGAS